MRERLQQARKSAGLSLRDLADQVGVSAMALSKYERGLIKPSPSVLAAISRALEVTEGFLQGEESRELQGVEYRASKRMTPISKNLIHREIRRKIEARLEAEALLPELRKQPLPLPKLPRQVSQYQDIEPVAQRVRDHWGLGHQPISSVTNVLEANGIRTFITNTIDGHFDGLSALYGDEPVVVTGSDWPGDRQRFTLAHELGHLVLQGRLAPDLEEERACHRFAGAFLLPLGVFGQHDNKSDIAPFDLYTLKHEWGISMAACLYRCSDTGLIDQADARSLWRHFRKEGWMEQEPGEPVAREQPTNLLRTIMRTWLDGRISDELAAALLEVPPTTLPRLADMAIEKEAG